MTEKIMQKVVQTQYGTFIEIPKKERNEIVTILEVKLK